MRQYRFVIIKNGKRDNVFCTAPRADWARLQVAAKYSGWEVSADPVADYEPNQFYAEIDARDMTAADADWLLRGAA